YPERLWYSLSTPEGDIHYDPIPRLPPPGWHTLDEGAVHILLLTIDLKDGYRFGVGVGLDKIIETEKALRNTFVLALVATLIVGALSGFVISRIFLNQVQQIKMATSKVGDGNLAYRLPLNGSGDEFDQLSGTINVMFSRI